MNFIEKLNNAIALNHSLLVVGLDPNPEMLPGSYQKGDNLIESSEAWLRSLITQTANLVCAYKLSLGFYQCLGAAGLNLLERILAAIPDEIPVILDAKHGDLNTSTIFAETAFEVWQVDAVTINPYAGQDLVAPFLLASDKAIFVQCRTSNPAAVPIQAYPAEDSPLYLQVVQEAKNWGTPEQVCLEVGTTTASILGKVRAIAPERFILARSIWAGNSDLNQFLTAGLNSSGDGLLLPVPQDILSSEDPIPEIKSLNEKVNQIRNKFIKEASSCDLWMPNVCFLNEHPYQDLILQLYDLGCILFGEYVQASGATFSYYIDLRKIISNPQIFNQVLNAYANILKSLTFDRIAGIPYGALPTATGLSLRLQHPMIFPRKEVKAHGTRRVIEGHFNPGEKVVVVDDILISGKSAIEGAEKIKSGGLIVEDIVVFIDHEGGVKDRLQASGYQGHSVLNISEITETLYEAGRINREQYEVLQHD
ncbi:MAG: bifunctional orotidine-5'-phosphate decarboxylase/orotate phosphoribosyltransferase [Oscillatoria sp. PMC 1068.18]|nr:bifunctional orotidine-5'-phosphate decarboxylase/orotate phosphoribosyltransferase [Oscillatoria sp. PMC 1076.18]MEC4989973.1 bifunctional orotidine-5'-phosphate decarboxylase/orotate phosphoribosyltransferase [Oscillatoria sp. PMC 1068.18]